MRALIRLFTAAAILGFAVSCAAPVGRQDDGGFQEPDRVNFRFVGRDTDIDNPVLDRRSYYKIYIDKAEEGRTTTGLESQEKVYEGMLPPNRHLITVEKWVLDEKDERYVKLNNIDQPKPNFVYFDLPERRVVVVEMEVAKDGTARFRVALERK